MNNKATLTDTDLLHFEQLKSEIQEEYLKTHSPSFESISKWKGIDIIYFQEDLRKKAKGNISEKTFYTYFKTSPTAKLPRIDMLNILSVYAGYQSWFEFKKQHLFANEILQKNEESLPGGSGEQAVVEITEEKATTEPEAAGFHLKKEEKISILQNNHSVNQNISKKEDISIPHPVRSSAGFVKRYLWLGISALLALFVGFLIFKDQILRKEFTYNFIDADRNSTIKAELQVQILKDNESPILYTAKPNEPFVYTTKSKVLKMVVSSPFYKTDTIRRNLETAPEKENIELIPDNYAQMLYYYTKNIRDLKSKRQQLASLISDNALIYQIFDNDTYGVETMDKQRYISFVTLPTTSLENLEVIETKVDSHGKIYQIKFKINEKAN